MWAHWSASLAGFLPCARHWDSTGNTVASPRNTHQPGPVPPDTDAEPDPCNRLGRPQLAPARVTIPIRNNDQPINFERGGWTSPCGSYYDHKMPLTMKKLGKNKDLLIMGCGNYTAYWGPPSQVAGEERERVHKPRALLFLGSRVRA